MRNAIKAGLIVAICLLSGCDGQSNSGLTNCRVCGGMVAVEAKACPHCGAHDPAPKPTVGDKMREGQAIQAEREAERQAEDPLRGKRDKGGWHGPKDIREKTADEMTEEELKEVWK